MKHEDLRMLKELRQKEIITEEQFEKRKQKLMEYRNNYHVYHVEPNHMQEMAKAHDASLAGLHPDAGQLHTTLSYHHNIENSQQHQATPKYHHAGTKSKMLAGLLGIFLGALGIHNFYLAHYMKAIVQLLITILSGGLFVLLPIVWGFVEGVLILAGVIKTDAHNIELK